jgi:hypothetical protein
MSFAIGSYDHGHDDHDDDWRVDARADWPCAGCEDPDAARHTCGRGDGPDTGDAIGRALYAELTRELAALDARSDYVEGRYANARDARHHDDANYWSGQFIAVNTARSDLRAILRVYAALA